ncbi:MAG: hypothetical protein GX811_11605 [Lentisphaerae bacterium]|nr:hypothetical protein [Lentisphaerota bacterium]
MNKRWELIGALLFVAFSVSLFADEPTNNAEFDRLLNPPPSIKAAKDACASLANKQDDRKRLLELGKKADAILDPIDKAPYLAIYVLGNIAHGSNKDAAVARDFLMKTLPNSPYTALLAFENISVQCSYCVGTGIIEVTCNRCAGSGECSLCKGSGVTKFGDSDKPCSVCSGTGKCKECSGVGKVERDCRTCGKRGRLLSKDKVITIYSEMLANHSYSQKLTDRVYSAISKGDTNAMFSVMRDLNSEQKKADAKDTPYNKAYSRELSALTGMLTEALPAELKEEQGPKLFEEPAPVSRPATRKPTPIPKASEEASESTEDVDVSEPIVEAEPSEEVSESEPAVEADAAEGVDSESEGSETTATSESEQVD